MARIEQEEVGNTAETAMLEGVIRDRDRHASTGQIPRSSVAVRIDRDRNLRMASRKKPRFVAARPISTREDAEHAARARERSEQVGDPGGLAGAPECEIADGNHGHRGIEDREPGAVIEAIAQPNQRAPGRTQRTEQLELASRPLPAEMSQIPVSQRDDSLQARIERIVDPPAQRVATASATGASPRNASSVSAGSDR